MVKHKTDRVNKTEGVRFRAVCKATHLSPQQRAHAEQQTPHPVVPVESFDAKDDAAKVDNQDLAGEAADPDADEDGVLLNAAEHVALIVDLSGVNLIEKGHKDECVENDGKVDVGLAQLGDVVVGDDAVHLHPVFDCSSRDEDK